LSVIMTKEMLSRNGGVCTVLVFEYETN